MLLLSFYLLPAAEESNIHNHPPGPVHSHRGGGGGGGSKSSKRARAGSINKNDPYDRGLVLGTMILMTTLLDSFIHSTTIIHHVVLTHFTITHIHSLQPIDPSHPSLSLLIHGDVRYWVIR